MTNLKVDSNLTGLRYAEEESIKVLPEYIAAVSATGSLTFGDVGSNNDTVDIGAETYTLKTVLSTGPTVSFEVLIGATAAETAANLAAAVNAGAGIGTKYSTGTTANADATATVTGSVVNLTATAVGAAGNSVGTTESCSVATFTNATLTGGSDQEGNPPIWYQAEPNGYSDFGGDTKLVARNPINPSRQRKKGVITDLDAKGGFTQDLTQNNSLRILQGFFFADLREKLNNIPMNGVAIAIASVVGGSKTINIASGGAGFVANDLIFDSGFDETVNNGLKSVASSTGTTVVVNETMTNETSSGDPKIQKVGYQFGASEVEIDVSGSYPKLKRASGSKDFTDFDLIPGEWVFIGGDTTGKRFALTTSNGFARIRSIATTYLEFDKTSSTMVADAGTGKTVQLFYGNVLKNESDPALIIRRSYNLERTLGEDDNGTMSEYLTGAVPNEITLQVKQADKVMIDMSFVAADHEQYDGTVGVKAGSRPDIVASDAFNTSNDFNRIKLHEVVAGETNSTPLFSYLTDVSLHIKNGVHPLKAVGTLGAFDMSAGTFEVGGSLTAYFAEIAAAQAVRNNADVSLDISLVKNNAGLLWDIPLIALGDGRLKVEQDKPITIPLKAEAAEGAAGHTLLLNEFPYLPNLADV